jgi:hypothetical protein
LSRDRAGLYGLLKTAESMVYLLSGIIGNAKAMEALVELIVYLDPDKGFRKAADYLGLFQSVEGRSSMTAVLDRRCRG